ncbi:hypothetical protein Tcan_12900 [Toxocara canis]|uniref:Uncharacterized protein n=1 Tax=Toxocara canis TaxID=6265 RepID=A0A0B2W5L6_TOXCA|nr:hypothetical protein Tcan_12900 [Toxocara canis]
MNNLVTVLFFFISFDAFITSAYLPLDDGIRGPKVAVAQEVRAKRAVIVRRRPIAAVYRAPVYYNQMAYQQPAAYPYQQPVYPYQPAVYAYRRAVYPRRRVWGGK